MEVAMVAGEKSCFWVFRRRGAIVGICARSEEEAAQTLREGGAGAVTLRASRLPLDDLPERDLVALGTIDLHTSLVEDYAAHDHGIVTLYDEEGGTWAMKPKADSALVGSGAYR
jgi:hypothetical protein